MVVLAVSGVAAAAEERRGVTVEFLGIKWEVKGLKGEIDGSLMEGRGLKEEARVWYGEGLKVVMELERVAEAAIDESLGVKMEIVNFS